MGSPLCESSDDCSVLIKVLHPYVCKRPETKSFIGWWTPPELANFRPPLRS